MKATGEQWGWKEEIKYMSIILGYWYFYTGGVMQKAEFGAILLPSLALIFTKFLLENVQPVFSVLAAWITATAGSHCAAKSPTSTWDNTAQTCVDPFPVLSRLPGSNLLHLLSF